MAAGPRPPGAAPPSHPPAPGSRALLFWETGGYWSLLAWRACRRLGLPLAPVSAARIAAGGLAGAGLLLVPGGWPSRKRTVLGEAGMAAIRDFVARGGSYLGLCGGAGLGLAVPEGLALLPLGRATAPERLPRLHGDVRCLPGEAATSFWQGIAAPARFHVWYPGQFASPAGPAVQVLARYLEPGPDLYSGDHPVARVASSAWAALEAAAGIPLDPQRLAGKPAVVAGSHGRGRVVLSHLHLDTPGDPAGATALVNLWRELGGPAPLAPAPPPPPPRGPAAVLAGRAAALWAQGAGLGLWRERPPALPFWPRGSRGLEFLTLRDFTRAAAGLPLSPGDAARLAEALAPLWREGPAVLAAMAARLAAGGLVPAPDSPEAAWFPAPRRTGGGLAAALAVLEEVVFRCLAAGWPFDNPRGRW